MKKNQIVIVSIKYIVPFDGVRKLPIGKVSCNDFNSVEELIKKMNETFGIASKYLLQLEQLDVAVLYAEYVVDFTEEFEEIEF